MLSLVFMKVKLYKLVKKEGVTPLFLLMNSF